MNPVATQKKRRGFVHRGVPARSLGMTSKPFAFAFAAAATLSLALSQGCAAKLDLEARACPCAEGWTCCPSRNVCVGAGETCDGPGPGLGVLGPDGGGLGSLGPIGSQNPYELAKAQSARCIVSAGDYVYWQNADGLVVGAPRNGGAFKVSQFRTPLADNPKCSLAVEGDSLFTTSYSIGKVIELSLRSNGEWHIGASGSLFGSVTTPSSLALTKDAVVVTEYEAGRVSLVPRSRAATVVLAEGLTRPEDVRVYSSPRGTFAYFVERGTSGEKNGTIKRVLVTESETPVVVETLATGLDGPASPVAVDGRIYFRAGHGLYSIPLDGGAVEVVLDERSGLSIGALALASDGNHLFFSRSSGIARASRDGREVVDLYPSTTAYVLSVDQGRIFWADSASVYTATK